MHYDMNPLGFVEKKEGVSDDFLYKLIWRRMNL